jgi:hypothetical protein
MKLGNTLDAVNVFYCTTDRQHNEKKSFALSLEWLDNFRDRTNNSLTSEWMVRVKGHGCITMILVSLQLNSNSTNKSTALKFYKKLDSA